MGLQAQAKKKGQTNGMKKKEIRLVNRSIYLHQKKYARKKEKRKSKLGRQFEFAPLFQIFLTNKIFFRKTRFANVR